MLPARTTSGIAKHISNTEKSSTSLRRNGGVELQRIWNDGHSGASQIFNYVLNLQGDVHQIRRASDGIIVAVYDYNAWGEVLFSSGWMAQHNPLRYRGKYFDNSTGLYYLQSRFYDPVVGRFINADGYVSTGQGILGFNMFTYCLNNPANMVDHDGYRGTNLHSSRTNAMATLMSRAAARSRAIAQAQQAAREREARARAMQQAGHTTATMVAARARMVQINGQWTVGTTSAALQTTQAGTPGPVLCFLAAALERGAEYALVGAIGGAAGGAAVGVWGAPISGGASIPVLALGGAVGGAVGGFVTGVAHEAVDRLRAWFRR